MVVIGDPAAGEQITDQAFIQAARGLEVEVLEAGGLAQLRSFQPGRQRDVGAIGGFAVDQQRELVGEVEPAAVLQAVQVLERAGRTTSRPSASRD